MARNVKYTCSVHGEFWDWVQYPKGSEPPTHARCPQCPVMAPRAAHVRRAGSAVKEG